MVWDSSIEVEHLSNLPPCPGTERHFPTSAVVRLLPPKLISPDSLAAKLRTAAVEYRLFIAIGSFNAGTVAVFGIVTIVHPLLGVGLADLAITSGVFIAVSSWIRLNQALGRAELTLGLGLLRNLSNGKE